VKNENFRPLNQLLNQTTIMKKTNHTPHTRTLLPKTIEGIKMNTPKTESKRTDDETLKLIHQLEVHQIELEMMNEELKRARLVAQQTAEKYTELFDFAPSGYFSLSREGVISEINMYASDMLGKERFNLINRRFVFFVSNDSKAIFNQFVNDIFENKEKQNCEITLTNNFNVFQYVQLAGKMSQTKEKCLVTMVDITELKKLSELNETLLTSLPYPAMYIRFSDHVILGANKIALDMGAKVGGQCWQEFGKTEYLSQADKKIAAKYPGVVPAEYGIKCSFCLADHCLMEFPDQRNPEIHAFGLIWDVHWIKVSKDTFLHYAVDITALKKAEDALKESELKFRTIANYTFDWELWVDINDNILYCSPSVEKITGYTESEFMQSPNLRLDIIYPDDLKKFQLHKQMEEMNQETNKEIQVRIIKKDGSIKWIGHVCQSVYDESGTFTGVRVNNRDITERKEMELQLFNNEQKYKNLSENINDGIFMCKSGVFVYVNQSMNSIFGYKDSEMIGMNINKIAMPEFQEEIKSVINLNATKNYSRKLEINCLKKDLNVVNVEMTFNYVANNKEIYGVVHDITEKKKIHSRNIVKAIILTEEKEKTSFSKELHDGLGPLLSTIKLYLQGLLRPKSNEMQHEIVLKAQFVLDEALISLSEISNKLSPHLLTEYGLTSAIQGFINKFERTSEVVINFNSSLNRRFELEIESALYRVIIECINNTIKHAKANNINIDMQNDGNSIFVNYKDDGIGFDLEKTLEMQKGLGLNNLENRIDGIGGSVKMYSEPGHGVDYQIKVNVNAVDS
jgi:PAS domain S-box-containing protein